MLEHKEQTVQCTKVTFIYSIHYMNQKKWEQHKDLKLKRSKGSNKTFANLICFLYIPSVPEKLSLEAVPSSG